MARRRAQVPSQRPWRIAKWLKGLPLPCACLLATDHIAPTFYIAATEPKTLPYEAIGVERRASTMRNFADSRVLKGMSAVEERACGRLTTGDVAAEMGCCVRLAEKLFRHDAGVSILEAIRRVRIERAMSLLRNRYIAIDAIPFRCGYGRSPACLKTHFKKATGLTMREWRKRHVS